MKNMVTKLNILQDEVDSGAEGIICLAFATDDEEYND